MAKISLDDLLKLPAADRAELAVALWDSLDEVESSTLPMSDAQREELDRRLAKHEAAPQSAIPWEVVRERLRRP